MNKLYGKDEGGYLESGNWNVAEPFAMYKIMRPLKEFSDYKRIAEFGSMELSEEFFITPEVKAEAKIKALRRMKSCLLEIIGNSLFAVNRKSDREELMQYQELLEDKITPLLELCAIVNTRTNGKKNILVIVEKPFETVLDLLIKTHNAILHPLNRNDLIFSTKDEETVEEFKERMVDRIVNQG